MARHFTKASSERLVYDITTGGIANFPFGTVAAWVKRASATNGIQAFLAFEDAGTNSPYSFFFTATNTLSAYNQAAQVDSTTTVTSTTEWTFIAWNKATGTATPRCHFYKPSTNAWTHENASGTQANTAGTPISIQIGGDNNGDYFDGDIAAVAVFRQRVLTDSEIERLPRGQWDLWVAEHDFLWEARSGRDVPVATTQSRHPDQSRSRTRQTASASTSGTTRAATADPPGFRFSRLTRRR